MKTQSFAASLLPVAVAIWIGASALARAQAPAQDLVVYVQNARRAGLQDDKIKQSATAAGWPIVAVEQALRLVKEGKGAEAPTTNGNASPPRPAQSPAPPPSAVPDDYQIGAGDTVQVSVWKEPDISVPNVAVRPDGMITVPLVKEVAVAGLTPRQVEKIITEKLSRFLNDANVTVVVTSSNSKKVYVIGAVRREGPLPYTYRMTIMQALSEAGGLTEYAKRKKIYVLRSDSGREYRLDFNYEEVVRGERMEQNVQLLPGDTVVIPN